MIVCKLSHSRSPRSNTLGPTEFRKYCRAVSEALDAVHGLGGGVLRTKRVSCVSPDMRLEEG